MKTVLYDIQAQKIISRFQGGYFVDGEKPELPEGLVELEEVHEEYPEINDTQKLSREITVDIEEGKYIHGYLVEEKTKQDIEQELLAKREGMILTRKQFSIAIAFYPHGEGVLKDAIDALIDSLTEPLKTIITITMNDSTIFRRMDEHLIQLSTALGMSAEDVDDFFNYALNEGWNE